MSKYAIETPSREEFYKQIKKQRERERRKRKLKGVNWFFILGIVLIVVGVYVYFETNFMLHDLAGVLIGALGVVPVLGRFMPEGEYIEAQEEQKNKLEKEPIWRDPTKSYLDFNIFHTKIFDD